MAGRGLGEQLLCVSSCVVANREDAWKEKMSEGMAEEMKQRVLLEQQRSEEERSLQEELVKQHELAKGKSLIT